MPSFAVIWCGMERHGTAWRGMPRLGTAQQGGLDLDESTMVLMFALSSMRRFSERGDGSDLPTRPNSRCSAYVSSTGLSVIAM